MKPQESQKVSLNPGLFKISRPAPLGIFVASSMLLNAAGTLAQSDGNSFMLEEIVVTAQRRAETVMDVPVSISAFSSEALTQRNIRDLDDIARSTPSLVAESGNEFGWGSVAIRGITSPGAGAATTGFYLDDVPLAQRNDDLGASVSPYVFDLERIEVLRGPQGTLYGGSAEGGALRYITPQPSLSERSFTVGGELASTTDGDPTHQFSVVGGMPLIDGKLGIRVGGFYRDEGGYIDRADPVTGAVLDENVDSATTTAARVALTWQATNALSVTPSVFYQKRDIDDTDLYWQSAPENQTFTMRAQPDEDEFTLSSLTFDYDADHFSVRSITSYLSRDNFQVNDWTNNDASTFHLIENDVLGVDAPIGIDLPVDYVGHMYANIEQETMTEELRFTSTDNADSKFSWVAGLYFQKNELKRERYQYGDVNEAIDALLPFLPPFTIFGPNITGPLSETLGLPVSYHESVKNTEEELAAYGSLTYAVSDVLSITLGSRFSKTEFDGSRFQEGPWVGGPTAAAGVQKESPITPKFNISYQPDDDTLIYASAAKGFRIGGNNPDYRGSPCSPDLPESGNPLTYGSDSLWSYEIGTKNTLAGGRMEVSFSAYHIDWSDIQTIVFLPSCANVYTDNLGEASSNGADVDLNMQLSQDFRLTLSAGYTDAEFEDTVVKNGITFTKEGQPLAVPKLSGSAALYYNHAFDGFDAYGNLSYSYVGSYDRSAPDDVFGGDAVIRDAEAVYSVSLRAGASFGAFDAALFVENLTDESPETTEVRIGQSSEILGRTLRPRTVGLSLQYGF